MSNDKINLLKIIGNNNGVIYVDKTEDVVKRAVELIENRMLKEYGSKARKFVEKYNRDGVVDNFEGILEEVSRGNVQ